MKRHFLIVGLMLLPLCQACQQQPAVSAAAVPADTASVAGQMLEDSLVEEEKMPFEYAIDSLYDGQVPSPGTGYFGEFEGDEPFWRLQFKGKRLIWDNYEGRAVEEAVRFSVEANRSFVVAFESAHLFGVVSRSATDTCMNAVTELPYLPMDIFFGCGGKTYVGCGILLGVDLRQG